jgi:hypothetical protein
LLAGWLKGKWGRAFPGGNAKIDDQLDDQPAFYQLDIVLAGGPAPGNAVFKLSTTRRMLQARFYAPLLCVNLRYLLH